MDYELWILVTWSLDVALRRHLYHCNHTTLKKSLYSYKRATWGRWKLLFGPWHCVIFVSDLPEDSAFRQLWFNRNGRRRMVHTVRSPVYSFSNHKKFSELNHTIVNHCRCHKWTTTTTIWSRPRNPKRSKRSKPCYWNENNDSGTAKQSLKDHGWYLTSSIIRRPHIWCDRSLYLGMIMSSETTIGPGCLATGVKNNLSLMTSWYNWCIPKFSLNAPIPFRRRELWRSSISQVGLRFSKIALTKNRAIQSLKCLKKLRCTWFLTGSQILGILEPYFEPL